MASKIVSEPPPAPMTSPRLPSNSTTRPATPRWSDGVDLRAAHLELGRRAALARLVAADAELVEDGVLVAVAGLLLHVEVAVEGDERAVLELAERVDLGQRQVVREEHAHQPRDDAGELRQVAAA